MTNSTTTCSTWREIGSLMLYFVFEPPTEKPREERKKNVHRTIANVVSDTCIATIISDTWRPIISNTQ